MSDHPFIYGIDFCFDPANPGTKDSEGHYTLGYGFIKRASESDPWTKVSGWDEPVQKNNAFGFQFWDLSESITQIDFVTISFRPAPGPIVPAANSSPFSDSDEKFLLDGMSLASNAQQGQSCGCGDGGTGTKAGYYFLVPSPRNPFVIKNSGSFEMTIEMTVTYNGTVMDFKCDPEMQVDT